MDILKKIRDIYLQKMGGQASKSLVGVAHASEEPVAGPEVTITGIDDGPTYSNAYSPEHYATTPQFKNAPSEVLRAILTAAKKHNVDPAFAGAVAQHESDARFAKGKLWDTNYRSFDGGVGLYQLTPSRGRPVGNPSYDQYSDDDLRDPNLNADLGVGQLAANIEKAKTRVSPDKVYRDAYLMYNAGPNYANAGKKSIQKFRERADRVMSLLGRSK